MNRTIRGMQCCCKQESHGDWMATEHNSAVANNLKQKYGVSGIPCLVVCKKDGTLVTKDGRAGVTSMVGPR